MNPIIYEDLLTEPSNQRRANSEPDLSTRSSHETTFPLQTTILTEDEYRHKITQLELRLAQESSQHNEEAGKLHEKLSKLQSTFEKNELSSQKLEYEVTLGQQKFNKEKRSREGQEEQSKKQILELQAKISELKLKLDSAEDLITEKKKRHQHELDRCYESRRIVDAANMELKKENELLFEEKLAAEQLVVNWKKKHEDLSGKCEVLEKQRQDHSFTIQKLIKDGEYASDLEQELMTKLKDLQGRIKTLEENIEAERAAHLETKFNTEVVQLKVRDTEKSLEVEKAKLKECRASLQEVDHKYRDLEGVYQKEKEQHAQIKIRHGKLREDHESQRIEMTDKNKHLDGISAEVKNYGHHVNELVKELDETKEKLLKAEKLNGSSRKEMEFLLNNHTVISDLAISPVKDSNWNFSNMTERVRRVIENYQTKVSKLDDKNQETLEALRKLEEECNVHREIAWNKDRAIEEAERLVKNAQNNLSKVQIKCAGYEERLDRFQEEEKQCKNRLVEKDEEILRLNQETCKNTLESDQLYQTHMRVLQVIYDLLMVSSSEEERNINSGSFSSKELKDMILNRIKENQENLKVISQKYRTVCEEMSKMKADLHHHKTGIKRLQKLNTQVLTQTEKSLTDGQNLCEKEKQKYQDEITILESKLKVSKEKLEDLLNRCDGVSIDEIPSLNQKINDYENRLYNSIIFTNFIQASFWGLLYQHHVLVYEKGTLMRMLHDLREMRHGVLGIVETLQDEMSSKKRKKILYSFPNTGVFRFRKIVIVVLAVNRLWKVHTYSRSVVLRHKPSYGHNGLLFYFHDQSINSDPKEKLLVIGLKSVLNEPPILKLPRADDDSGEIDIRPLCTCYADYLQSLSRSFKKSSVLSLKGDTGEFSLLRTLGKGLRKNLERKKEFQYPTSEHVVELLRDHILGFAEKLHQTEELRTTDKIKYKENKHKYEKEMERHRNEAAILKVKEKSLKEQLKQLENSMHDMISEVEFDDVCSDLKNALQREDDLQKLFEQQLEEIRRMETRIGKHEASFDQKNQELADSLSALRAAQMNLSRAEDHANEVRQKVSVLKQDKLHLQKCSEDQEKKISLFIRDRELLARYMRHVTTVIYNAKKQLTQSPDALYTALTQLVADKTLSQEGSDGKKAPEMQLVENAVNIFFDAQRESMMTASILMTEKEDLQKKIRRLQDEVSAHKTHIRTLRERVSALFQQDISGDAKNLLMTSMTHGAIFVPLQEN